jgi:hypothetical protein
VIKILNTEEGFYKILSPLLHLTYFTSALPPKILSKS